MSEAEEDIILLRIACENIRRLKHGVEFHGRLRLVQGNTGVYGLKVDADGDDPFVVGGAPDGEH